MLLGLALGDAYGAPFENLSYIKASEKLASDGLVCGTYTDDTQQALAVAELLASGQSCSPETMADFFLTAYKRDKRFGYSEMTQKMLASDSPKLFLESISTVEKVNRKTDGAAMRALPIGFLPERDGVICCAGLSASITHGHPDAIAATIGIALIAHHRLYHHTPFSEIWSAVREDIRKIHPDIIRYCDTCALLKSPEREILLESYAEYGVPYTESRIFLGSVLFLLIQYGSDPMRLLIESILLGGDTDTVAAVVLGAALITGGEGSEIWNLVSALEDGPFGKKYLIYIGDQLSMRYPAPSEL